MSNCELVTKNINDLRSYLRTYEKDDRGAALELLISQAISHIFHLPFYNSDNNDVNVEHKVVWNGKDTTPPKCGPPNNSDTIVYARDYDVLIEITNSSGRKQWVKEFGSGLRHFEIYIKGSEKSKDSTYIFLIAPKIHLDTYNSIRQRVIEGDHIIIFTFEDIKNILAVCNLIIGLRHVDLIILLDRLLRCIIDNGSLSDYDKKSADLINEWRKALLKDDRLVFLGVKGYKVFKEKKVDYMSASDILTELQTQLDVKNYFQIMESLPERRDVYDGMLTFGFAYESGIPRSDPILSVASELDINQRIQEIQDSIQNP